MKSSNFQIAIIIIFIFFVGVGLLMFSGVINFGSSETDVKGTVTLWGTLDSQKMGKVLDNLNRGADVTIQYQEQLASTFNQHLIEALASGTGPDMFILPQDSIWYYRNKVLPIPYVSFSERDFKDTFIAESELYLGQAGVSALPISIDPLVMYWNRDIFQAKGIANAPKDWDEVKSVAVSLTNKTDSGTISKSGVALGQFNNVDHAKDIMSLIMLQMGNPITTISNNLLLSTIRQSSGSSTYLPVEEALKFYAQFSDPTGEAYTWNRSLPRARDQFAGGNLAIYFGYASELFNIQAANPNLNFDVAPMPTFKGAIPMTFGNMNAVAVSKATLQPNVAYTAMSKFITPEFGTAFSSEFSLPPVRRDLIATKPPNPYAVVFYNQAILARAWLDPKPEETTNIWRSMLDDYLTNTLSSYQSVWNAAAHMELLVRQ